MKIKILGCGTSTGVPVPGCGCDVCRSNDPRNHRTRASAFLTGEGLPSILIDTSIDLRQQALAARIGRIDAVLYTHSHADHILGLEDLRGYNIAQRAAIPLYGTRATLADIKRMFSYVFDPRPDYEGGIVTQVSALEISHHQSFDVFGLRVLPFKMIHGATCATGYRIGALGYATDCKELPERTIECLKGVEVLVLDGLRFQPHRTHMTIPEAIETAAKIGARRTILTHMTHTVEYSTVSSSLPAGVELAVDGLEEEFDEHGWHD